MQSEGEAAYHLPILHIPLLQKSGHFFLKQPRRTIYFWLLWTGQCWPRNVFMDLLESSTEKWQLQWPGHLAKRWNFPHPCIHLLRTGLFYLEHPKRTMYFLALLTYLSWLVRVLCREVTAAEVRPYVWGSLSSWALLSDACHYQRNLQSPMVAKLNRKWTFDYLCFKFNEKRLKSYRVQHPR